MERMIARKQYFILRYKKKAEEWKVCNDDRKIFSNMYYLILNSLNELIESKITSVYTIIAFNKAMNKDTDKMDEILCRFADMEGK